MGERFWAKMSCPRPGQPRPRRWLPFLLSLLGGRASLRVRACCVSCTPRRTARCGRGRGTSQINREQAPRGLLLSEERRSALTKLALVCVRAGWAQCVHTSITLSPPVSSHCLPGAFVAFMGQWPGREKRQGAMSDSNNDSNNPTHECSASAVLPAALLYRIPSGGAGRATPRPEQQPPPDSVLVREWSTITPAGERETH